MSFIHLVMTVAASAECPSFCSGHGKCSPAGKCVCKPPYYGDACELRPVVRAPNKTLRPLPLSSRNHFSHSHAHFFGRLSAALTARVTDAASWTPSVPATASVTKASPAPPATAPSLPRAATIAAATAHASRAVSARVMRDLAAPIVRSSCRHQPAASRSASSAALAAASVGRAASASALRASRAPNALTRATAARHPLPKPPTRRRCG